MSNHEVCPQKQYILSKLMHFTICWNNMDIDVLVYYTNQVHNIRYIQIVNTLHLSGMFQ